MRARSLLLLGLLLPRVSWAQQPLTMREAVQQALATHPTLQQAEAVLARSEATLREQRATLLPALNADASLTRFELPMVVAPLHGFDPGNPPLFDRTLVQGSLSLGYTLWDGGARGARLARAGAQVEAARAAEESARANLIAETVQRYAALATVQQLIAAHEAAVRALTVEQSRAAQLFEQGRAPRVAVLRADAALSKAQAELATVQSQRDVAESNLARAVGMNVSALRTRTLTIVRDTVAVTYPTNLDATQLLEQALSRHPEARRLRALATAAEAGEAEARSTWWPRVSLGSRYVRYGSGEGDAGGEVQGDVQLNYALFSGGARPAAQDRARAEQRLASAELALLELRIGEMIDRALAELTNTRARARALTAAVTQFAEVARIEKLALDNGAGVQSDYLAAETELLRARASLAEARMSEVVALVELARASGVLTSAWIDNLETSS